jgi:hypothetical protein
MNKPLNLLLGATLCHNSDNTPLVLTGDNNKDIKVEKSELGEGKEKYVNKLLQRILTRTRNRTIGTNILAKPNPASDQKMAMARGLHRDQYFGQKSKQQILEEIIIGTCLGMH